MKLLDLSFDIIYLISNFNDELYVKWPLLCKLTASSTNRFNNQLNKHGKWTCNSKTCCFVNGKKHGDYIEYHDGLITLWQLYNFDLLEQTVFKYVKDMSLKKNTRNVGEIIKYIETFSDICNKYYYIGVSTIGKGYNIIMSHVNWLDKRVYRWGC